MLRSLCRILHYKVNFQAFANFKTVFFFVYFQTSVFTIMITFWNRFAREMCLNVLNYPSFPYSTYYLVSNAEH